MMSRRLLASGRDADIFEHGANLVLRRSRDGRSMAAEASVMEFVRSRGFPVPAVESVSSDGSELIMERIQGPTMVSLLSRKPWLVGSCGRLLASLHIRLHALDAPATLQPAPTGDGHRILHLDLHPLNVMMSPRGPVVIDWTGAARGDPDIDVALTWLLLAVGDVPPGSLAAALSRWGRKRLIAGYLGQFNQASLEKALDPVVRWKIKDPHMSSREIAAMWALLHALGRQA